MAEGGGRDPNVLLANCFEIKRKRHRVSLTPTHILWEPEGSPDFRQQVPLYEVVAVRPAEQSRSGCLTGCLTSPEEEDDQFHSLHELVSFHLTAFRLLFVERGWKHRWKLRSLTFHNADSTVIHVWMTKIQELLDKFLHRPRRLLVFVNPFGGKKRASRIYEQKIRPLFELAGIDTQVIKTERANHAKDLLQELSLAKIDGVVAVGGDGTYSEVLNGLILRTQKESGINANDMKSQPQSPILRIGIIAAGSTNCMAYSVTGTNDPITSALHIIIGDSLPVDVTGVFHENRLLQYYTTLLGYGFLGDVLVESEKNRWLGPRRYNWAGFKKFLKNKAYEGEVLFRSQPPAETTPFDGPVCRSGCKVCERAPSLLSKSKTVKKKGAPESWSCVRGKFVAINNSVSACISGLNTNGVSPLAHLGDGCNDLILIHKCSRVNFMRFFLRFSLNYNNPFALNFIQVYRVREFHFRPISAEEANDANYERSFNETPNLKSSIWNCEGEIIQEPAVSVKVFCQLVQLFARGPEELPLEPSCLSCTGAEFKKP